MTVAFCHIASSRRPSILGAVSVYTAGTSEAEKTFPNEKSTTRRIETPLQKNEFMLLFWVKSQVNMAGLFEYFLN
jgi:hypothetical protein